MSKAYPRDLRKIVLDAGRSLGLQSCIHEGIYFQTSGPAYETAAEARLMRLVGADVVGNSLFLLKIVLPALTFNSHILCQLCWESIYSRYTLTTNNSACFLMWVSTASR